VSVAELQSLGDSEFGRTPPQDLYAEQCVVGGMLLSKDAIADVVEVLRPGDFYRPAHQVLFDVVIDLYGRGEPADAVTVAAELTKRGEITRVGGADYLHTLMALVPVAANAGYYARIVHERAILRRLVEVGSRITQMGYAADADVDEIVDRAQAEVYAVTERRTGDDYMRLGDVLPTTLDEIEAIGSRGGAIFGVPTGFSELDQLTNGMHPGQMIIVAARPAMGKALALDTPLPTPDGWTTMGEVRVGDQLLGADGRPTTVIAATEVMYGRPCHRMRFSDGTGIIADAHHQWLTEGALSATGCVRTTEEIADCAPSTHAIANTAPLDLPPGELPIAPYALGVWLGGGMSESFVTTDPDIFCGVDAAAFGASLRAVMPTRPEHVPVDYLRSSRAQRAMLLAGLLDAGGHVMADGSVTFDCANRRLATGIAELAVSLGHVCFVGETTAGQRLTIVAADDVFRAERMRLMHKERRRARHHGVGRRYITAVEPVASVPVRCVQVDNADHMYLAGRSMVPTHNSTLALDFARAAAVKNSLATVIFSLEMSRSEITMRLLSAEAKVALHSMRSGAMSDDDWTRLARRMSEVSEAPLFIDDSPNLSMMEIRAKARRLKQQHDLRMVIVDYMQLMQSPRRVESRQQEVSEISRSMKLLAKEIDVPVIALSQLNRGPEQRNDKKPQLSDLRESGCLTAGTRLLRADTGAEITLGELLADNTHDVPVWSLDDRLKLVPRTLTHAFPSGVKETFRVRLSSGRQVEATANHPFLTLDGWRPLGELTDGSRVGVLRHIPAPIENRPWRDDEVTLLARVIGDGSSVGGQPIRYASRDHEKFVPAGVFGLPKRQVGLFLRHIWASHGSVRWDPKAGHGRIDYVSTSRRLVDDIARLLLRFNVFSRIKTARKPGDRHGYLLCVCGAENQLRFLDEIGVHGERGTTGRLLAEQLRGIPGDTSLDTVPVEIWTRVKAALQEKQRTHREFAAAKGTRFSASTPWEHAPSRTRLARVAAVLRDAELDVLATNDVHWDTIVAIEPMGEQPVFDATVLGTHNFVANGIAVHNSLEQDADMVVLLHREDAYERESPRAGEADLIVAKHRNGPTKTVTVAFQGHYSRFVDMAPV
jgi:replicative DNA helicase